MVSYLTTLFLGKPPGGSFPLLSAHSVTSNSQLVFLESAEEGNYFPQKKVLDTRIDRETAAWEADMLPTELPRPVPQLYCIRTETYYIFCAGNHLVVTELSFIFSVVSLFLRTHVGARTNILFLHVLPTTLLVCCYVVM